MQGTQKYLVPRGFRGFSGLGDEGLGERYAIGPVAGSGLRGFGDVNAMPGTYGGVEQYSCGCGGPGLVGAASGIEAMIRAHPFIAIGIAFLIGHSVKSKGR